MTPAPAHRAGLEDLFNACWAAIQDRQGTMAPDRPPVAPAHLGELAADAVPRRDFPVLHHLPRALAVAAHGDLAYLADLFAQNLDNLSWSQNPSYEKGGADAGFMSGYAYAALSGPNGPLIRDAPTCGFILLAPDLHYPGHQHATREFYLPLTPGAKWRLGSGEWFEVGSGHLIFHDAWVIHATKTPAHPFLAFVAWLDPSERDAIRWVDV